MISPAGRPATERIVAGRYRLLRSLGRGGMGTVWLAEDELLGRSVAVKEVSFPPDLPDHEQELLRKRTLREARTAARLDHPNAVTVYDVVTEDGWPYIVMELVRARTLADVVRTEGPRSPRETARIGLGILSALEAAHALGIVHRDVKPGNVMLREDGRAVLMDFGIATAGDDTTTITGAGLLIGSPAYMAPERVNGEDPAPVSDLWSLGATLYAAVEGRAAFERSEPMLTMAAIMAGQPAPFRRAGMLAPLLGRLLARDPADRPTAAETRDALVAVLNAPIPPEPTPRPVPAPAPAPVVESPPKVAEPEPEPEPEPEVVEPEPVQVAPAPQWEDRGYLPEARPRGSRAAAVVAGLALLIVALVGAAWLSGRGDAPGATQTPAASPQPQEQVAGQVTDAQQATEETDEDPEEVAAAPAPEPAPAPSGQTSPSTDPSAVPAGFTRQFSPVGGSVAVPSGWEARPEQDGHIDFVESGTGTYLRFAWRSPPDPAGALGAWQEYAPQFGSRWNEYQTIRIEQVEYRGWDAADWEYSYDGMHAINRGFVVTGTNYAFGLNLVTREADWEETRELFDIFTATFQPPSP
jgi:eukaryotic-like serine/threonine-protein kinase